MGNGVVQIAEFLIANKHKIANVVIDGQACAVSLYDAIKRELSAKQVLLPNAMQVASCASLLRDRLEDGTIKHSGQEVFNETVPHIVKRPIGNKGAWGFGGAVDTTPIESASLALLASRTAKINPDKKQKML